MGIALEPGHRAASARTPQASARIVLAKNGGAIRTIVGHGSIRAVSVYPSVKAGYAMPTEAPHERMLVRICEADPQVVDYQTQPHRLEIPLNDRAKPVIYFPDCIRQMADGAIEVIETKKTASEFTRSSSYAWKLDLAEQVYADLGWRFRRLSQQDDIDVKPLWPNARMISVRNKRRVTSADQLRFQEAVLKRNGTVAFAEAVEVMTDSATSPLPVATTLVHALVCRRIAWIDIAARIDRDTPVRLVGPSAASTIRTLDQFVDGDLASGSRILAEAA